MEQLVAFVKESLAKGHTREEIRFVLSQARWPGDEIDDALSRFADVPFPVPVPRRRQSGSAREAFLYLVTFVALYGVAFATGGLLFGLVDHFLPDPIADRYNYGGERSELRWLIATLMVSFPLYLGLMRMHLRAYARDAERRTSSVRRWLTYLTLFVAACVIIGWMISLIGNVLGGEIAARFLLKCLIALTLAGTIFAYYLWELRDKEQTA